MRYLSILILILVSLETVYSQNAAINSDGSDPDNSAMLDVKSTSKGMLIPRMTSVQRNAISSPATGLLVFDNTTNSFWFYNGTTWDELTSETKDSDAQNLTLDGNTLNISGGTGVDLSAFAEEDNLGNHTATSNIQLNGKWLSNDGGDEGINIDSIGNVGIGRAVGTVGYKRLELYGTVANAAGPHSQYITSSDNYPVLQNLNWTHDNISFNFDSYFDGAWKSSDTGSNFQIAKFSDLLSFNYDAGIAQGSGISWNTGLAMDKNGNIGVGANPTSGASLYIVPSASNGTLLASHGGDAHSWIPYTDGGIYLTGDVDSGLGDIIFRKYSGTTYSELMRLDASNNNVGIGTSTPNSNSTLELADNNKGFLINRLTNAQKDTLGGNLSASDKGMLIYDNENNTLYGWNGSSWNNFLDNTDAQNLSLSGDTLNISGGTGVSLGSLSHSLIKDADGNTKIDVEKAANEDTIRFDIAGTERYKFTNTSLEFLTGSDILIGHNSHYNVLNSSTYSNIIIGNDAGTTLNIFRNSVVMGNNAALTNEGVPDNNVIIGNDALRYASGKKAGADDAVIIGRYAAGNISNGRPDRSVIIGTHAMENFSSGETSYNIDDNIAIGYSAMRNFNGIQRNIAIGSYAMGNGTGTARANVAIGSRAGYNAANIDNVYIGDYTGYNNTGTANVFIGHNAGYNETGSNLLYIENTNGTTPLIWGDFENDKVGINRVAATNTLEVGGNASKASAGSWLANSDARLKKNIKELNSKEMLDKLLSLKGITYQWNDDKTGNKRPEGVQYGFTAQNIQNVFPTLVTEDNTGYLQTAYGTYDAMTIEAIRALKNEIEDLKNTIKSQDKQLTELRQIKEDISALKALLNLNQNTSR